MRPPVRVWVWTAAALALVVVAALLWRGSDAAATDSTTAGPAGVPSGRPAAALSAAWTAPTTVPGPAPRAAVHAGRVVVADQHGVRALDVGTGDEAWRYSRANARLCDWTLAGSLVVAVFRTEDRCDEALALSAETGVRGWTRNVNFRGDMTLSSTDGIVLAASPTGVATLDPVANTLRWRQAATEGCRIEDADVGEAGAVVLQRCPASWQVQLFDGDEGSPRWTRDVADGTTLAGVDRAVVLSGDAGVQLLSGSDGSPLGPPVAPPAEQVLAAGFGEIALVLAEGILTAVDQATGEARWRVPAIGLPASPAERRLLSGVPVPESGRLVLRDLATGAELARSGAPGLRAGGLTTLAGSVVVAQLPDRVIAYR